MMALGRWDADIKKRDEQAEENVESATVFA